MWCYPYSCPSNACDWGNGTRYFPWPHIFQRGADEGVVRPLPGIYEETFYWGGPAIYAAPCRIIPDSGPVTMR